MKRLHFLIFCILCFFTVSAVNPEKEYKKLISKLDVAEEAKSLKDSHPSEFWKAAINNNEVFSKFKKDIKKGKGAEKEVLQKMADIPRFYPQYDGAIIESMQGFCDSLLIDMGIADLNLNCSLHIVNTHEVNAFTALTEEGFVMCVTSGLLDQKGLNYYILMGYVAHEFTHGVPMHHIRGLYAEAKERRKNELIGGISAGLNGFAAGMEAYNAAYGVPTSGTNYGAIIANIDTEIKLSTLKYSFKFSREQEYEADLMAFRFLQNLGYGNEFINGLRVLGTEYDHLYNEYSDHPTISSRIAFLNYVQEHPELGNKENPKLKKKKN